MVFRQFNGTDEGEVFQRDIIGMSTPLQLFKTRSIQGRRRFFDEQR